MENDSCSDLQSGYLPTTGEYFQSLSTLYIVMLSLCGAMAVISVISYMESVYFLMKNLHNWKPKDKAIWLLGLYPVLCTTSFVGLMIPRSSTLNDMMSSLYLSMCVYLFVVMLMGHFGGQHRMSKKLASNKLNLRSPPLCCCCMCLPQLDISTFRLRVLELTVLQFAVIRPILAYLTALMWSDKRYVAEDLDTDSSYTWINFVNILSTLMALYGFSIVYQISRVPLQKVSVRPKFLVLQLVLIFSNFQPIFISIFVAAGVVPCEGQLTAKANGDRWHHILYIFEIFVISWVARLYYRRHVGDIPPEEQIIVETAETGSMTTGTLQRQVSEHKQKYGTVIEAEVGKNTKQGNVPNGLPSVSQAVSTNTSGGFTDISTATNTSSGSDSSNNQNEMEEFLNSIVLREKGKRSRPPVNSAFTESQEQTVNRGEGSGVADTNTIKLEMPTPNDSQSQA